MKKALRFLLTLTILFVLFLNSQAVRATEPIKISIFIGLGAGTSSDQIKEENELVKEWNNEHKDISTILFISASHATPQDALMTLMASGNAPNIIGPIGAGSMGSMHNLWADLTPFIQKDKDEINLADYAPETLKALSVGEKIYGLPLTIHPSFLYINEDLFKQAGVELPPAQYEPNGTATYKGKPWDMNAVRELAMQLTKDSNGKSPNDSGFDPNKIATYGFADSWSNFRGWVTHFDPQNAGLKDDLKTANFDQKPYQDAMTYLHDAVFKDHFMPSTSVNTYDIAFPQGNIAMWYSHTWYLCCVNDAKFKWSIAVAPAAPDGKLTARINIDTFSMTKDSPYHSAAWEVLKWLNSPKIAARLAKIYQGMPARQSLWDQWFTDTHTNYPQMDETIIKGAVKYADIPNSESYLPNQNKVGVALDDYFRLVQSEPTLDPIPELKKLNTNIQTIFDDYDPYSDVNFYMNRMDDAAIMSNPPVKSVAMSPNSRVALVGRSDGLVKLWDIQSGRIIRTFKIDESSVILSTAYSPDGQSVVLGIGKNAYIWNIASTTLQQTLTGHTENIASVAYSPDGNLLMTGSADGSARLWDVKTGQQLLKLGDETKPILTVAFSPDGKTVLSAGRDNRASLWDAKTGKLIKTFVGHTETITSAVFAPDGKSILTGSEDNTAILWDVDSAKALTTFKGHSDFIFSVAFSPDGKQVATASCDHTIRLWDVATGTSTGVLRGHSDGVRSISYSPDGSFLLSGSDDKTVRVWDIKSQQITATYPEHIGYIEDVAFSPDNKTLATASRDGMIHLWNVSSREHIKSFEGHIGGVLHLTFSPDGKMILSGGEDGTSRLWNVQTGKLIHTLISNDHSGSTTAIAGVTFSPDGKNILTGSKDSTLQLWSVESGLKLQRLYRYYADIYSMAFSSDARHVIVGDYDGTTWIWGTTDNSPSNPQITKLGKRPRGVNSVTLSQDGTLAASSSNDRTIQVWNAQTGATLHTFTLPDDVITSVAFSPNNKMMLAGGKSGVAYLWNLNTGQVTNKLVGHSEGIISITFSSDGKLAATGGLDGRAMVWDVQTGKIVDDFRYTPNY